jgi:ParB family transcriptional regulator, chromosome partitioning protein
VANPKKKALGRGLDALLTSSPSDIEHPAPPVQPEGAKEQLLYLDPRAIERNPGQPRTVFREESLGELADSIRREGVQEPVIVRPRGNGYELVSGERRVRASIMADLERVPAICRQVSDNDMLKLGLIENIQREDLNAIELATAYQRLIDEFHWTQEELASQVGKKRVTVTNTLRLLNLPEDVQRAVSEDKITMGHARALLALESPLAQSAACRQIIDKGLSVRQVEKMAQPKKPARERTGHDTQLAHLEDDLRRKLGTKVRLQADEKHRGKIEIEFFSLDELDRLLDLLGSLS